MSDPCPCCGQPLPKRKIVVIDEDRGVVVFDGFAVPLRKDPLAIVKALHEAAPRVVSRERLWAMLYDMRAESEEPEMKIIDVYVCQARKALARAGLTIGNKWGQGYWLTVPAEEARDAAA